MAKFAAVLLWAAFLIPTQASDIVLAVPTYSKHHFMLAVSRNTWRNGVFTVVSTESDSPEHVLDDQRYEHEVWVAGPDGTGYGWEGKGGNKAEQRCTSLLRAANATAGLYNWILSGDDDIVWLMDNVKQLVQRLDATKPLYVTDGFLNDVWTACALTHEAAAPLRSSSGCVRAKPTQPCTRGELEKPDVCRSELLRGIQPGNWTSGGVQMGAYGNAGYMVSRELMHSISVEDWLACEQCNTSRFKCMYGADFRIGECILAFGANGAGIGPTLPSLDGSVRVFGHDFLEVQRLAEGVVNTGECDARCAKVLSTVVSVSISEHGVQREEYERAVVHFYDVYTRAKAILQRRKRMIPRPAPDVSPFTFDVATDPFLLSTVEPKPGETLLPEPFWDNFRECMLDPLNTPTRYHRYGPFPPLEGGFTLPGFKALDYPVVHLGKLPRVNHSRPGVPTRSLPGPLAFKELMLALNRSSPVFLHAFARDVSQRGDFEYHAEYVPMVVNWMGHAARVGLSDHVLFVGATARDCAEVSAFAPCIVNPQLLERSWPDMHRSPTNFRWIYIYLLLQAGYDVVSLHSDALLLRNPVPLLERGKDLASMSNAFLPPTGTVECGDGASLCPSTAFTYFRGTPLVFDAVANMTLSYDGGLEHVAWSETYVPRLLEQQVYSSLPLTGDAVFANWDNVVSPMMRKHKLSFNLTMLHVGKVGRGDTKAFHLRCMQLWFDESNLEEQL